MLMSRVLSVGSDTLGRWVIMARSLAFSVTPLVV
jgi:hypothetical protein